MNTSTIETVLLTQREAATYLHTTVKSLNTLRYHGRNTLPYLRWGKCIRYRKSDLDAWIESQLENNREKNNG